MNKGFFEPDPNTKSWVTLSHEEHEQLLKRNRVCEECIKATEMRHKISDNYNDFENKEEPENEYYL